MKKTFLLLALLTSIFCQATDWYSDIDIAKRQALKLDKLILLDFTASWCKPCLEMDRSVWSDQEIEKLMENFIPLKIDLDTNRSLAQKYSVRAIPSILIIDANGNVIHMFEGFKNKAKLKKEIEKYGISTKFFKEELSDFSKDASCKNGLALAEKQLDFSLSCGNEVKKIFLKSAMEYLDLATKKANKKDDNYEKHKQRIALLRVYKFLHEKKFEKAQQKLSKNFSEAMILKDNLDIYYATEYVALKGLANSSSEASLEKLKALDNGNVVLQKANAILK